MAAWVWPATSAEQEPRHKESLAPSIIPYAPWDKTDLPLENVSVHFEVEPTIWSNNVYKATLCHTVRQSVREQDSSGPSQPHLTTQSRGYLSHFSPHSRGPSQSPLTTQQGFKAQTSRGRLGESNTTNPRLCQGFGPHTCSSLHLSAADNFYCSEIPCLKEKPLVWGDGLVGKNTF